MKAFSLLLTVLMLGLFLLPNTAMALNTVDEPAVLAGDANGDGEISAQDIVRLKNYFANLDYESGLSTVEIFPGADVNQDGSVTAQDIVRLKNHFASLDYSSYQVKDVPLICQHPDWPTGCESISTVMLLQYAGYDVTPAEFINGHVPICPLSVGFYNQNDRRYGPNPYLTFVGEPSDRGSYGCFLPVIQSALLSYGVPEERIIDASGSTLAELAKTHLTKDRPVIIWCGMNMVLPQYKAEWYFSDETFFRWPKGEHCMLLVGFDESRYYFNDPQTGQVVSFDKEVSEASYLAYGQQALTLTNA